MRAQNIRGQPFNVEATSVAYYYFILKIPKPIEPEKTTLIKGNYNSQAFEKYVSIAAIRKRNPIASPY